MQQYIADGHRHIKLSRIGVVHPADGVPTGLNMKIYCFFCFHWNPTFVCEIRYATLPLDKNELKKNRMQASYFQIPIKAIDY
jgi:hypothetical protein